MREQSLHCLNRLTKIIYGIFLLIFIMYTIFSIYIHQYYQKQASQEKFHILQEYYNRILELTLNHLNYLALKVPTNLEKSTITIDTNNYIQICYNKCISYNKFKFSTLLDKFIPKFIYYKIKLNNDMLCANTNKSKYTITKAYRINDHTQLNISILIDKAFWNKTEHKIKKPFYLLSLFILVNFLLLYLLYKTMLSHCKKEYKSYYKNENSVYLKQLKAEHKKELSDRETSLMKKIWDIEFAKQKDLEINCLFSQAANKLVFMNEQHSNYDEMIKNYGVQNISNRMPCSIVLYQNHMVEEVSTSKLIEFFTNRFKKEDENISIKISSSLEVIKFISQAALYQIIYSLINYILFLLKKQFPVVKRQINLSLNQKDTKFKLNLEYDGIPIKNEEELLNMSSNFFKTHTNPFLLNINQIFNMLRSNDFYCKVSYDKINVIEIAEKFQKSTRIVDKKNDNIVHITSFKKEKNE